MRRTQFLTAAIVAAVTFFCLQSFIGSRYPGYGSWHNGRYLMDRGRYCRPGDIAPTDQNRGFDRRQAPTQPLRPEDTTDRSNY